MDHAPAFLENDPAQRQRAEMAFLAGSRFSQIFLDCANDLIQSIDRTGRFLYVNRAWRETLGYDDTEIAALSIFNILDPDCRENCALLFRDIAAGKISHTYEVVFVTKSGRRIPVEGKISTDFRDGELVATRGIFRDISQRKEAEDLLRDQKLLTEKLIRYSAVPIFVLDPQHRVTDWNRACEMLTGIPAEQMVGTTNHWQAFYREKRPCLADLVIDSSDRHNLADLYTAAKKSELLEEGIHAEEWLDAVGGARRYLSCDAVPIYNRGKELVAVIETLHDLTERKKMEEALTRLATTDTLTGIYNRGKIEESLRQEMARSMRYGSPLAIILFDLDYFKKINDSLGHSIGDQVLKEVAATVGAQIRETDVLGRWGGEEFIVLCPGIVAQEAITIAEKLRQQVEGLPLGVTISCGLAGSRSGESMDALINRADKALYAAKHAGRNLVRMAA
jgi:diguanylate cyclase (GGDEF)-like protein/PAS domain S-box-containing protein